MILTYKVIRGTNGDSSLSLRMGMTVEVVILNDRLSENSTHGSIASPRVGFGVSKIK